jgi:hypothetical protein
MRTEEQYAFVSIGIRHFYRLIKVLKDLKVISYHKGYVISRVEKYLERFLPERENKNDNKPETNLPYTYKGSNRFTYVPI